MAEATTPESTNEVTPAEKSESDKKPNTGMAIVAYLLFFVPLLTESKDDPFVKYHVKQSLMLDIVWIVGTLILSIIPIIGWMILPIFNIAFIVLWIIGIINAANGHQKQLPILGKYAEEMLKF